MVSRESRVLGRGTTSSRVYRNRRYLSRVPAASQRDVYKLGNRADPVSRHIDRNWDGPTKTKASNCDYHNRAPRLGPTPPQPRPGPHHPRPGAPRRQRRSDADGRGRSGRPLLFQPPREGETTPLPRHAQPLPLLFRSDSPTEGGGTTLTSRGMRPCFLPSFWSGRELLSCSSTPDWPDLKTRALKSFNKHPKCGKNKNHLDDFYLL